MASGRLVVGGEEVTPYNDEYLSQVRARYGVGADELAERRQFSFDSMRHGGGKGGDLLAFTSDGKYIIKEVGKGDQQTLLRISAALVQHVCTAPGGSLIARFFMHFNRPQDSKDYVVMNNWLPLTDAPGSLEWAEVYDLKGSADDKLLTRHGKSVPTEHKRCWHVHKYFQCCWTEQRHTYYWGKQHAYEVPFHCTPLDREAIMQMVEQDAHFMREQGLMDYSIIVGVQRQENYTPGQDCRFSPSVAVGQPYVALHERTATAYYLGIIDFLQDWSGGKKLAMYIKKPVAPQPQSTVPPDEYADQFVRHFDRKFVADAQDLPQPSGSGIRAGYGGVGGGASADSVGVRIAMSSSGEQQGDYT